MRPTPPSLSDQDWHALAQYPAWQQMVAEQRELVAGVIETHGQLAGWRPDSGADRARRSTAVPGHRHRHPARAGLGIVTGLGQYTEHMRMPGMLYTRTLRSPHPHAKIKSSTRQQRRSSRACTRCSTAATCRREYQDVKLGSRRRPTRFLFDEEVFEVGAPVAVVAADSEHIADEAMRAIEVQYEVLPAAMDLMEAMKSSTPKQFDSKLDGPRSASRHRSSAATRPRRRPT